ncbi:hypothetical protein KP509_36G061900 [Ceratopteris richardii]|uniref:histone acetyltransferase n=1 Tax=Ceratopteris richardii TaxID=49495 RepID=A0A8T2QDJ4_CERRI|nr:hypothetical protein KP509_36G061900 [Ceratopteris richardii]KAH7281755.1 hypothetical protein KP509_36G061900 [Ceratopteris richardii]
MQSQAQGGAHQGQNPQVMNNGFPVSRNSLAAGFKLWHKEDDSNLRLQVLSHIQQLVQKRGVEQNLSEIAKDVETALYLDASTREEYADFQTLDLRLYSLMVRLRNSQSQKCFQKGTQPGLAFSKSTTPSSSIGGVHCSSISSGIFGGNNPGGSFSYNIGIPPPVTDFNGNVLASFNGHGPSPVQCFNQGQRFAVNGHGFGVTGIVNPGQNGFNNAGTLTAGSCMIPTPGLNVRSFGPVSKLSESEVRNCPLESSTEVSRLSNIQDHYAGGSAPFRRDSVVSEEATLATARLPENGRAAAKTTDATNFSSVNGGAQGFEQSVIHSQILPHVRQQPLSDGVLGVNMPAVQSGDVLEDTGFYTSTLPTRFDAGNLCSLASGVTNLVTEKQKQVARNQVAAKGDCLIEGGANGALLYLSPPNDTKRELSSPSQSAYLIEVHDSQYVQEECDGSHWHSQQPHHQNLLVDPQVNPGEQACQANSADTGQSEVVSNDDGTMARKPKDEGNYVRRQQWLLIFLRHVSRCIDSGKCTVTHCAVGRELWKHIAACQVYPCSYPRCSSLKWLLGHHQKCRNPKCPVCGPVRRYFLQHAATLRAKVHNGANMQPDNCRKELASVEVDSPPVKRAKLDTLDTDVPKTMQQTQKYESSDWQDKLSTSTNGSISPIRPSLDIRKESLCQGTEASSLKQDSHTESSLSASSHSQDHTTRLLGEDTTDLDSSAPNNSTTLQEASSPLRKSEVLIRPSIAVTGIVPSKASIDVKKPEKSRISGISFIESFSPEQIREHISSLRKWIGQSKCKAEKNQAVERQMLPTACSACGVENLHFDPIPIFCTQCGCRIKRNYIYHSTGAGENSFNFCGPCYNSIRDDVLETDGFKVQKSTLVKKKNDEQRVEGWVECDKCKKWQHQICVLFNARINKERSEYVCPDCCIAEMEKSERTCLLGNPVPGAKDLPRTMLSDYLEERLALKLEEEKLERSGSLGKGMEEVPTAEGLVVRVLSSVDKKLDVKPKFLELFQQDDYPKDFMYKSKMVMLFQKIEGVEVCLFGMYVQEFGSENPRPNHRWVYISYLDSVKYFRPDVKTCKGEALRTFVYHEILIGYLDYCKRRGFSSCYIWACPPLKGDDYILYCHPEIQKTPKTDKLREWYLNMIGKAKKEKIVVANRNLYDYFFTTGNDCKAKITAARLPYFDGDYWPGAAEDILQQLEQEKDGYYSQRRGKLNKIVPKRTTKTSSQTDVANSQSKDFQLMSKLGQSIAAMKEDFIIVQMHHACSRCRIFIITGQRWFCQQCSGSFQLCASCYEEHEKLEDEDKHPAGKKEFHQLFLDEVCDVSADTKDRDDIMESEFFDNRHAFLSLCQGNQYQYDTLRRAKHSSMMVLYHLHNPNAPAFIASCAMCHSELEAGQGWRCKTCTDFDVCNSCYSSGEIQKHPHVFTVRSSSADLSTASTDWRKQRMLQLRMMLDVLVHASKCVDPSCQYPKCRNMKELFRHGNSCTKRANGGCSNCKRMWFLLTTHARTCKESVCTVPRCIDIRKHLKRAQLQQDSRRRAAVNEMIRQRAAEAAGTQC